MSGPRPGFRAAAAAPLLAALVVVAGCAGAPAPRDGAGAADAARTAVAVPVGPVEARPAGAWRAGAMVAAANPHAVDAGLAVLRAGGSAVDAAIAVQAVLGLVEPQSSGIGGGAFLLHYDAATGDVSAYDGREVAPAGATPTMFLLADGRPMPFWDAVKSGRSTGVPGAIAMLALAHADHGRLPWAESWRGAIDLAERGFEVSPRFSELIGSVQRWSPLAPDAAAYLTTDGTTPLPAGHLLRNPAYADTLRRIAREGPRGFYEGPVAQAIVAAAGRAPLPGTLRLEDLAAYRANRLEPLCAAYRVYQVCGMRPPSSGGVAVLSILGVLERFDLASHGAPDPRGWHLLIEAQRLAYADRDMYVADDRFEAVPLAGLLDRDYLASRAALVSPDRAMARVEAGNPPGSTRRGRDATGIENGTSHFVVVDGRGNVVSMTTTIEGAFGSQRMAAGFFLNNQLTDFSFRPVDDAGQPIANAVAPGKKPRSSMSPTIVFRNGAFELAVGSPGGNSIIAYVAKAIVGMLDWNLSPQQAVDLPNVIARGAVVAEAKLDPGIRAALEALGHEFRPGRGGEGSGLHAVRIMPDGRLAGAADARREGKAVALP